MARTTPVCSSAPPSGVRAKCGPVPLAGIGIAGPLCLVIVAGLALPPHWGWGLPLGVTMVMAVVGYRRLGRWDQVRRAWASPDAGPIARGARAVAVMLVMVVLLSVLARGIGVVLVEIPAALGAAIVGCVVGPVAGWIGPRLSARVRPVVWLGLACLVPVAGVLGARYEAEGPQSRGWAYSGPILGIHPFQTTSVLIDGQGPFDIAINDYVEPDGARGYGPSELADALDRALVAVAQRVYPEGPARIRRALIDADVDVVVTPAVWERLDREPTPDEVTRLVVRSGSWGRGSRVEFVCPGRRIDPRGPQGESVMNKMCPDKYASEASAGLGVTGRWPGYSEGRGMDRLGLFRLARWTRSDDAQGRRVLELETRWLAWAVLLLVGVGAAGPLRRFASGVRGIGGALGLVAVGGAMVLCITAWGFLPVGVYPDGPSWQGWPPVTIWTPALALGAMGLFAFEGDRAPPGSASGRGVWLWGVVIVVATMAIAANLSALSWALPMHPVDGARWSAWIRGGAEAIGERGGLNIFEIEGAVAGGVVGILFGGAVAVAQAGRAALRCLVPTSWPDWTPAAAVGVGVGLAAGLVVSAKTAGAAALIPGVIGVLLGLGCVGSTRGASPARHPVGHRLIVIGWTILGVALLWGGLEPRPHHWFVTACRVIGSLVIVGVGVVSLSRTSNPPNGA